MISSKVFICIFSSMAYKSADLCANEKSIIIDKRVIQGGLCDWKSWKLWPSFLRDKQNLYFYGVISMKYVWTWGYHKKGIEHCFTPLIWSWNVLHIMIKILWWNKFPQTLLPCPHVFHIYDIYWKNVANSIWVTQ